MSLILLEVLVGILLVAGLYFAGRLVWLLFVVGWVWRRESRRARTELQRQLAA
jgi:hypothetical protein